MREPQPYLTVVVFNLTASITEKNITDFFEKRIQNSKPLLRSLVQKRDRSRTATVTIRGKSDRLLRDELDRIKKAGSDRSPLNPTAGFDYTFIGLTPLYESSRESPLFEYRHRCRSW